MSTRETEALPPLNTFRERAVWAVLCVAWKAVRFPVVALMIILEPVVRLLLAGAGETGETQEMGPKR